MTDREVGSSARTPSELIAQARELLEKATPGPWKLNASPSDYPRVEGGDIAGGLASVHYLKDAGLIAAAPSLIDSLATALQEAERENAALLKANEKLAANCLAWSKAEKKDKATLAEVEGKLSAAEAVAKAWDDVPSWVVAGQTNSNMLTLLEAAEKLAAILEGEGS